MVTLSKNFTLTEYTKSQTALRLGIDNTPNEDHLASAKLLFERVVQPVRDHFGPTVINSGYRGPELNAAIRGAATSQHCRSEAKKQCKRKGGERERERLPKSSAVSALLPTTGQKTCFYSVHCVSTQNKTAQTNGQNQKV